MPSSEQFNAMLEVTPLVEGVEAMREERAAFVRELVATDCISEAYASSGKLERFPVDPKTHRDGLKHLFGAEETIPDTIGGLHHLPTFIKVGLPNVSVAATIFLPNKYHEIVQPGAHGKNIHIREVVPFEQQYASLKSKQERSESGAYHLYHISKTIPHPTDPEATIELVKDRGSSMFPDEWTTEQVIDSILNVADRVAVKHDEKRRSFSRYGFVDGVLIRVDTDSPEPGGYIKGSAILLEAPKNLQLSPLNPAQHPARVG